MKKVSRNSTVFHFNKNNKVALEVEVNQPFLLEAPDAQGGKIRSNKDILYNGVDLDHVNPCVGPVYIKGAEPGDTIIIEIIGIQCVSNGFICILPNDGVLKAYTEAYTHIFSIDKNKAYFDENIEIPLKPMIGTIGTTPIESIPTGRSGIHGGNFDAPILRAGTKLYLPVFVPGALILAGDCHAAQGDSEFSMGIEVVADIILKVANIIKNIQVPGPFIESKDFWATIATGDTIKEALVGVSKNMADFLIRKLGITMSQAAVILSCVGNVRLCQATGIDVYTSTIRMEIPKAIDRLQRLDAF